MLCRILEYYQDNMKISYAITVCNELEEITKLLNLLLKRRRKTDEIVVLFDKKGGTPEVWSRLQELNDEENCTVHSATFKNHFADWKNKLTKLCTGDYIFQIDADEYPHETLISAISRRFVGPQPDEILTTL